MHMAKVVVKLLNGDYADEGGMIADIRLMVDNCRRYVLRLPRRGLVDPDPSCYRSAGSGGYIILPCPLPTQTSRPKVLVAHVLLALSFFALERSACRRLCCRCCVLVSCGAWL